jgi:hypothetical protein
MEKAEYEWLLNKGFRIIRKNKNKIEIRTKKGGWGFLENYSDDRWYELLYNDKILKDE